MSNECKRLIKLGKKFFKCGEYDSALSHYNKVLVIDPDNADAMSLKGDTLLKMDKYEDAITCWAKVMWMTGLTKDTAKHGLPELFQ